MVEEKGYSKILEWMQSLSKDIKEIREVLHDHSQKFETIFDILQEMRDDLRILKRNVVLHEDEINELKKRVGEMSKHLHL